MNTDKVDAANAAALTSPCVGICTLDAQSICLGCQRTADEITRWAVMDAAERDAVLQRIEGLGAA